MSSSRGDVEGLSGATKPFLLFFCFRFLAMSYFAISRNRRMHGWMAAGVAHAVEGEGGAVERGVGSVSVEAPREPRPSKEP